MEQAWNRYETGMGQRHGTGMEQRMEQAWDTRGTQLYLPLMTLPRVDRDLLIAAPSCKRAPTAPVDSALSLYKNTSLTSPDVPP